MVNEKELKADLQAEVGAFGAYLRQLRTGRATPDLFENIKVRAYETDMDIKSTANVIIESAISVVIQPYDKSIVANIIKGIQDANLGYNPVDDGGKVRVSIPALTEEKRKETVKKMYLDLEETHRKHVRQIRSDYMHKLDRLEGVSEDQISAGKKVIQKHVDETIAELDKLASDKELDIMSLD